jgi:hypothetical protein
MFRKQIPPRFSLLRSDDDAFVCPFVIWFTSSDRNADLFLSHINAYVLHHQTTTTGFSWFDSNGFDVFADQKGCPQ